MTIARTESDTPSSSEQRIAELEAVVAQLAARLEASEAALRQPTPAVDTTVAGAASRRNLLKLAAGAAAGGAAMTLAGPSGRAAADDLDSLQVGETTTQGTSGRTSTVLRYVNDEGPEVPAVPSGTAGANILTVRDDPPGTADFNPSRSSTPSALAGYAFSTVANGVYGYTQNGGSGVVAFGAGVASSGLLALGTRANIDISPSGFAPLDRTDPHRVGEMVADETGDLWYCTDAGIPGTWAKLAGAATAGAFHAVTPFRVYDSRQEPLGAFDGGENRTISVADSRDVETYAVVTADAVPAGATAVTGNVVAIGTTDTGFLSINPGGITAISAATLNWVPGQNIGNAGVFTLDDDRALEAIFGPGNGAHMTIDITGYYL